MPLFSATAPLTLAELAAALHSREVPALASPPAALPLAPSAAPAGSLLLAHTYGTGPEVPPELVRRLLLLKVQRLSSGPEPQLAMARRLLQFFQRDVWPVVHEQGGEAAALAHLGLPLLGLGEVNYQGYRLAAADVLGLFGWEPVLVAAAEEQALLAGQPLALAYATEAFERTQHLQAAAGVLADLSAEAAAPLDAAASLPTSLAAAHQLTTTAASPAALAGVAQVLAVACNTAAAGPPLAPALGQLLLLLADLAAAAAQRTAQWLPGSPAAEDSSPEPLRMLPAAAAGLAEHLHQLSAPTAPSAASPADQAVLRARQAYQAAELAEQVLGIELLAATQALDQRGDAGSRPALAAVRAAFRAHVTFVRPGQVLAPSLHRAARFVREYQWA